MGWQKEHRQIISIRRMQMTRSAVREKSYGSVKTFWLDRDYINRQLGTVVDSLRTDPNVVKIVLFGSFAEDRAVPGSDVDILLVLQSDSRRFIDRIQDYLDIFAELGIAADVFPYTVNELDNPLVQTALRTGKVLFGR
jgi:predicted nucleotidyltransferase